MVQKHVLDTIDDDRLQVFVVWEPMLPGDSRKIAKKSSKIFHDKRVTQFWIGDHGLAKTFMKPLGLKKMPAWDVYLFYSKGRKWTDESPAPDFFMHRLPELPEEKLIDGKKLADKIRKFLISSPD